MSSAEFVVDRGYAARASLAVMRWPRPLGWVLYLYPPFVVILGLTLFWGQPSGTSLVVIGALATVAIPLIVYLRSTSVLRRLLPVGTTISATFDSSDFTVQRAGARVTLSYDQVTRARRIGDIVAYRNINGLTWVLPGSVVTEADLARLGGPR
jgi:hypothetical protein